MKQACLRLLACALLGLAVGCGPGTGGTGTGVGASSADRLAAFGAQPASVCAAPFAAGLDCASNSAQPQDMLAGTLPVHLADTGGGQAVVATIADNAIDLVARCQALRFVGDWGVATASNESRFFGQVTLGQDPTLWPAVLSVRPEPAAGPQGLVVTLQATDGRVLLGPLVLLRVAAPVEPTRACP